ncbi:MAG: hypothetical protein AAGB51_07855 [Planctomycetota bacterium]
MPRDMLSWFKPGASLGAAALLLAASPAHVPITPATSESFSPNVTSTGATPPGQCGFGIADGTVNIDDLGFFLNFWLLGAP